MGIIEHRTGFQHKLLNSLVYDEAYTGTKEARLASGLFQAFKAVKSKLHRTKVGLA